MLSGRSRATLKTFPFFTAASIGACSCWPGSTTTPPLISKSYFSGWVSCAAAKLPGPAAAQNLLDESATALPVKNNFENFRRPIIVRHPFTHTPARRSFDGDDTALPAIRNEDLRGLETLRC